jgi:4-amino-4-deoxy-L-arabinose transferase-like glycosyltransferase
LTSATVKTEVPDARGERRAWALLAAITAIGLALRLPSFGDSLFGDELSAFYIVAGHGFGQMMHLLNGHSTELNPPLFFILAWGSVKVFGLSAMALKLVSLLTGTATIPLVYLLGRRTVSGPAGLVAAALAAGCPFLIYYSSEARPYALMVFLVLVATLALLQALASPGWGWWGLYALAACAAAYTHFTSVFVLVVLFLWALVTQPAARGRLLLATGGAVILYLPELPVLHRIGQSPGTSIYGTLDPLTLSSARTDLGHWAIGHPNISLDQVPGTVAAVLIALGVAVALVGGAMKLRSGRGGRSGAGARSGRAPWSATTVLVVLLAVAAPVGAALYTVLHQSVWGARNVISSWPALAVTAGALAVFPGAVWRRTATTLLVAGFALGGISMLSTSHHRPDYAGAVAYLNHVDRSGGPVAEIVVLTPGPPTPTEAALALAAASRQHRVFRIGAPPLPAVLAVPPYTSLPLQRGETVARDASAAAGSGPLFLVAPISAPGSALEALRRRHLHSTNGDFGLLASFLGALPARLRLTGSNTLPGLLPVTVYVYR